MGDGEPVVIDGSSDQRRAHAKTIGARSGFLLDAGMRIKAGLRQRLVGRQTGIKAGGGHLGHGANRKRAGKFACIQATHAIGQGKDP